MQLLKKDKSVLVLALCLAAGVFLLLDLAYSFYQHDHMPLKGDVADVVFPSPTRGYYDVLQDPFGLDVLLKGETYPNPNRFFAHWTTREYFLHVPLFLQHFTQPLDSVYLSAAIAKIFIQLLILFLLAAYITGQKNPFSADFLIAAGMMAPLFQASGFSRSIGIIDSSVIYTFFYALPIGLLMLFFLPFFMNLYHGMALRFKWPHGILAVASMIYLGLNGPLVPGVVLILCPMMLAASGFKAFSPPENTPSGINRVFNTLKKIPLVPTLIFGVFCILSLYSLYIGRNNSMNELDTASLADRYRALPAGLFGLLSKNIAWPLLMAGLAINAIIIRRFHYTDEGKKVLRLMLFLGIFAFLYILLLPLGGYRAYRPGIVRYDTILPVTLAAFLLIGSSSIFVIRNLNRPAKKYYAAALMVFLLFFELSDRVQTEDYRCERAGFEQIIRATETVVRLDNDCPVMGWFTVDRPETSEQNARLMKYWNIVDEPRLFYHQP